MEKINLLVDIEALMAAVRRLTVSEGQAILSTLEFEGSTLSNAGDPEPSQNPPEREM